MSSPKHLWSGDWERDSEAAARERARRLEDRPPTEPPPVPTESAPTAAGRPPAPAGRSRPAPRPRLGPLLRKLRGSFALERAQRRLALVLGAVALIVAGGAYGLGALLDGSNSSQAPGSASAEAWLGLQMQSLANGTVVVASVVPGSPAAAAGLQPGDVITQIESRPVGAPIDVTEAVAALRAGDTIEIQLVRGSGSYTARVRLTARPASFP